MTRLVLAVLALAACKQAHDPPAGQALVGRAHELADTMCACRDRACGAALRDKREALVKALPGVDLTDEEVAGLANEDQRFVTCMDALAR